MVVAYHCYASSAADVKDLLAEHGILGSGLPEWIDITRELLSGLSNDEQSAITGDNARTLFNL